MLLLILGCDSKLFDSDVKANTAEGKAVDDVHFSCTIAKCVQYQAYFPPSYDTTGLNIQSCLEDLPIEYIQILDTVIVYHTGNTADAADLCYREHISTQNLYSESPDSCFCVSGVEY